MLRFHLIQPHTPFLVGLDESGAPLEEKCANLCQDGSTGAKYSSGRSCSRLANIILRSLTLPARQVCSQAARGSPTC